MLSVRVCVLHIQWNVLLTWPCHHFNGLFLLPLPTMANGDCITTNSKRIHVGWRIDVKWSRSRAIRCSNSLRLRHNYWLNDNSQCTWFRSSANPILHKLWAIKPISTVFALFFINRTFFSIAAIRRLDFRFSSLEIYFCIKIPMCSYGVLKFR